MTLDFQIKINPRYVELVRPLSDKERAELRESIREKGLHLPIIINPDNTILDGHHRYQICNELDIEPRYEVKTFENLLEEKSFVIDINDKRRQLNDFGKAEMAYRLEEIESEKARLRQLSQLKDVKDNLPISSIEDNGEKEKGRVVNIVSKKVGISRGTYERGKFVIKYGTEETKEKLRHGKTTINKEYEKIRKDIKRQEYLEKCKDNTSFSAVDNNYNSLILGDFREVAKDIASNSIDLILTDPPYADTPENLTLYEELATLAFRVLKPGGSIVFFVGHIILNKVFRIFDDSGLTYWWIFAVKHSGRHSKIHARHIFTQWKPTLMYVKGKAGPDEFSTSNTIEDFIESVRPAKILHECEQSTTEAEYIITNLTLENQIVLDPMLGSGTTGEAATTLNRKFIGIEKDEEIFKLARMRLIKIIVSDDKKNINGENKKWFV